MEKSNYDRWSTRDLLDTASRTSRNDNNRGNVFLDEHGNPKAVLTPPPVPEQKQEPVN